MATYFSGFVCDENCGNLGKSVPKPFGLATLPNIGLVEGSTDAALLRSARKHGRIIITKNEVDFERAMKAAPESCNSQHCRCGGGLITVSDSLQSLPFKKITHELKLDSIKIDWEDVFESNLQVSVRGDWSINVTRLAMCSWELERRPRCPLCKRIHT